MIEEIQKRSLADLSVYISTSLLCDYYISALLMHIIILLDKLNNRRREDLSFVKQYLTNVEHV